MAQEGNRWLNIPTNGIFFPNGLTWLGLTWLGLTWLGLTWLGLARRGNKYGNLARRFCLIVVIGRVYFKRGSFGWSHVALSTG